MKQLRSVVVPDGMDELFGVFWKLQSGEKIRYSEIRAFMEVTGNCLSPSEVDAIMAMDSEYQAFVAERLREVRHA